MDTADPDAVWQAIKDKVSLCIYPPMEEKERMLKCLLLAKEVPLTAQVLMAMEDRDNLTKEDRALINELFESLEVEQSQMALACSVMGRLSRNLKPRQLMVVLQATIMPLIQIKMTSALLEPDAPGGTMELPEEQEERVELLMILDPTSKSLK